jgi:DNA-binding HxlR family transcriptional regulator
MVLKLLLIENEKILFEMPLNINYWSKEKLKEEMQNIEEDFAYFSKLFNALSSGCRLKMMRKIFEDEDLMLSFSDFMKELNLNPKTVSENMRKLQECNLLEKTEDGKYKCSKFGEIEFLIISIALNRIHKIIKAIVYERGEKFDFK